MDGSMMAESSRFQWTLVVPQEATDMEEIAVEDVAEAEAGLVTGGRGGERQAEAEAGPTRGPTEDVKTLEKKEETGQTQEAEVVHKNSPIHPVHTAFDLYSSHFSSLRLNETSCQFSSQVNEIIVTLMLQCQN